MQHDQLHHRVSIGGNLTYDDTCGQTLLTLVARGSAIITELFRLVEMIPAPFRHQEIFVSTSQYDQNKKIHSDQLICDFSYFKNADAVEARIEADEILKRADEELCDTYIDILTRFYLTFESVYRYSRDLNDFMRDLENETFVGQSLESRLANNESRQLLCEAYFLLGYMMLTVDNNFEGSLRERMIVSYYRYSSYKSSPESNVDDTCNLMRATGFKSRQQQVYRSSTPNNYHRPENYPESLFARLSVNHSVVNLLIAKMQSVDIYNQTVSAFPHPDHRSSALGQQAAMLYVILYFCPNILNSQRSRMREIADKFFYDNWVISVYMGEIVNLFEAWEPYKAAKEAMAQLIEAESASALVGANVTRFYKLSKQLQENLKEGWLTQDTAIDNHNRILNSIRDSNIVFKWLLLHSQMQPHWQLRSSKTMHDTLVDNLPERKTLYLFLQNLSELEKKFSVICDEILLTKNLRIKESKQKVQELLDDLIGIFSDAKPMRWIQAGTSSKLVDLLTKLTTDLDTIDLSKPNGRDSIIKLIANIESARDSYSDGKSLQVVQLFTHAKESLLYILRLFTLNDDIKITLQTVGEFSYAWRITNDIFTNHMQQVIKDDPLKVYGLESIFLKLASSFDTHLIRIQQVDSKADLISVSQYYSTKLVAYIRDVLQVIPATILELVAQVIAIQTDNVIGNMPAKVPLDSLKDYAQPEKRFQLLELTYKISHYAESLLMMQNTTIGLIRINSSQLLEDGIRRELVKRMSDSIQGILQFPSSLSAIISNPVAAANNLLDKLEQLDFMMNGYKRSFEYIQDYLFIYGLRIWQEELSRIVKFNVEIACMTLQAGSDLQSGYQSTLEQQSVYQSAKAPIPVYGANGLQSSFMMRTLNELLNLTDPRATIYDEQMSAWYEQKPSRNKVLDLRAFELIASSLSATGLRGLDEMCCTLLMLELEKLDSHLLTLVLSGSHQSQTLVDSLQSIEGLRGLQAASTTPASEVSRQSANRIFSTALSRMAPHSDTVVNYLLRIGQLQAIRVNLSAVISTKCRYEARNLYNCLDTLNATLMATLRSGKKSTSQQKAATRAHGIASESIGRAEQSAANAAAATSVNHDDTKQAQNATMATSPPSEGSVGLDEDKDRGEYSSQSLEESQLIFELANHLEWVGLSDPLSKVYTLALDASSSSQVFELRRRMIGVDLIFLILLDACCKLYFSRSINGFLPKLAKSFFEPNCTIDGQPLFYGVVTLLLHFKPFLNLNTSSNDNLTKSEPLTRLLELMGLYVKCLLCPAPASSQNSIIGEPLKAQELSPKIANVILGMIELMRLSRRSPRELLADNHLPQFLADTFQFASCHLNSGGLNKN